MCLCDLCLLALMQFDAPHNVLDETWDRQITADELKRIYSQYQASTTADEGMVIIMHKPTDSHIITEFFEMSNIQQPQHFFWHKKDHQTPTSPNLLVNSVEMGTLGHYPRAGLVKHNLPKNPFKRHNFIDLPQITKYALYSNGDKVNSSQKPPGLNQWLCSMYAKPGSTVLIIGAGAGGDVLGAIDAGCNVVAVERCEKQYQQLQKIIFNKKSEVQQQRENAIKEQQKISNSSSSSNSVVGLTDVDEDDTRLTDTTIMKHKNSSEDCIECGEPLAEGYDKNMICTTCKWQKPLHPNCCFELTPGKYICLSCKEKQA